MAFELPRRAEVRPTRAGMAVGPEDALTPLDDGSFRVGEEEWSPERLRFDAVVADEALRANLSGCDYYRVTAQ
jgi:hypothetical protein